MPMSPVGFELTISVGERPQTYALDRAATGTGIFLIRILKWNSSPLRTKLFPADLKTQSVPRSKHSLTGL